MSSESTGTYQTDEEYAAAASEAEIARRDNERWKDLEDYAAALDEIDALKEKLKSLFTGEDLRARADRRMPEMLRAAWGAFRRDKMGRLGPGPGFVEAIGAAIDILVEEEENARR